MALILQQPPRTDDWREIKHWRQNVYDMLEHLTVNDGNLVIDGDFTVGGALYVDTIYEFTLNAGVLIEDVLIKDGYIEVDIINEYTLNAGVIIEDVSFEDGTIAIGPGAFNSFGNWIVVTDKDVDGVGSSRQGVTALVRRTADAGGHLTGADFQASQRNAGTSSARMTGVIALATSVLDATLTGGLYGDMRGAWIKARGKDGSSWGHVYGAFIEAECDEGFTVGGNLAALNVVVEKNATGIVTGKSYGMKIECVGDIDYGLYVFGADANYIDTLVVGTLLLPDTDDSNVLEIIWNEDDVADRVINLYVDGASRAITLVGSPTLGGWFDQNVKQAASPTFAGMTLSGALDMNDNLINNLANPVDLADAVNLDTLLDHVGVSLRYWLGNATLNLTLTDAEAALTETPNAEPDELTNIFFQSSVADTPTPFMITQGSTIEVHFDADETTGAGRNIGLYFQLGYVDSDLDPPSFVQIGGDSDTTPPLTVAKTNYAVHIHVASDITIPAGKRMWLKGWSITVSGAGGYPEINVYYNKSIHHMVIPVAGSVLGNFVPKRLFDANTVLYATSDDTPVALTVNEQTVVGRLTGEDISAVTLGIADNNLIQIDDAAVADNMYGKFTAAGIEGRSYAEVLADLSGQAGAGFDWNAQVLSNIGSVETVGDINVAPGTGVAQIIILSADSDAWCKLDGVDDSALILYENTALKAYFQWNAGLGDLQIKSAGDIFLDATGDIDCDSNDLVNVGAIDCNTITIATTEALAFADGGSVNLIATTVGTPGADTTLVTEQGIREAIAAIPGGGDVSAAANIGDHEIVRGDGGVKGVQDTPGVTLADNGDLAGVGTIANTGNFTMTKVDPEIRLVDSGDSQYTRVTRTDTDALAQRRNVVGVLTGSLSGDYTEVDPRPNLTVDATSVTITNARRDNDYYVYKDYGVDYFGSNWTHEFEFQHDSGGGTGGLILPWAVGNTIDDAFDWLGAVDAIIFYTNGAKSQWKLWGMNPNNGQTFNGALFNLDQLYYARIVKTGTAVVMSIYDDSARTSLVETKTLILASDQKFRYHFATQSYNVGDAVLSSGLSQNHNIGAGIIGEASDVEIVVWSSKDGTNPNEKGIQTYGDPDGRHIIEGKTIRFNIGGAEVAQIDASGNWGLDGGNLSSVGTIECGAITVILPNAPIFTVTELDLTGSDIGDLGYAPLLTGTPTTFPSGVGIKDAIVLFGNTIADSDPQIVFATDTLDHLKFLCYDLTADKFVFDDALKIEGTLGCGAITSTDTSQIAKLGIGKAPDVPLHVVIGDGVDPTYLSGRTVAVFQNNDDVGDAAYVTIISGTTASGGILFGDSGFDRGGQITYNQNSNSMAFVTANATAITISNGQICTFAHKIVETGCRVIKGDAIAMIREFMDSETGEPDEHGLRGFDLKGLYSKYPEVIGRTEWAEADGSTRITYGERTSVKTDILYRSTIQQQELIEALEARVKELEKN